MGARRVSRPLWWMLLLLPWAPAFVEAQQPMGSLELRFVDVRTARPLVDAWVRAGVGGPEGVTDHTGLILLEGLAAGPLLVEVIHVAHGFDTVHVEVQPDRLTRLRVELSDRVIVLAPLEVTVLSAGERQVRAAGFRRNVVTREQIGRVGGGNLTLGEVLGQFVPGVRVRSAGGIAGSLSCIELRSAPANPSRCLSPVVYLDGSPITNPLLLYASLPMDMIETIEVVPTAEAGARYGTGALYGALLLETRRPGREGREGGPSLVERPRFHDWSTESTRHPFLLSFGGAAAGNGLGLAAGVAIATACIGTVPPAHDRITTTCDVWTTVGALGAALALPALGSGLGSMVGGRTAGSRGRLLTAAVAATMGLAPGYSLVLTGRRLDSDLLRGVGVGTLLVAPPVLSMLSDRQFRKVHAPLP